MSETITFIEPRVRQAPRIAKFISKMRGISYDLPRDSVGYDVLVRKQRTLTGTREIAALINNPTALSILAVTPGDTIAGLLLAHHHATTKNTSIIDHIFVAPTHQNKGIGEALLHRTSAWAGGDDEVVFAVLNNEAAIRFYERNGFVGEFSYGQVDSRLDFLKMRRTNQQEEIAI